MADPNPQMDVDTSVEDMEVDAWEMESVIEFCTSMKGFVNFSTRDVPTTPLKLVVAGGEPAWQYIASGIPFTSRTAANLSCFSLRFRRGLALSILVLQKLPPLDGQGLGILFCLGTVENCLRR